jgi:hypothetical protein
VLRGSPGRAHDGGERTGREPEVHFIAQSAEIEPPRFVVAREAGPLQQRLAGLLDLNAAAEPCPSRFSTQSS